MGNPIFQWRRFWYPRNSEPKFHDGDFLTDPDEYRQFQSKTNLVHSLETLTNRCVVFLGEPSSGKSRTIGTEGIDRAAIEGHIRQSGDRVTWIDLRGFDSSADVAAAFASDSVIRSWVSTPKQKLHLFLDSLDECRLSIPVISHVLLREFRQLDIERLCLRIACRTAEWPTFLELELQKMYREEIAVLQLAPLREKDVQEAARTFGVDSGIFLRKMRELGATPFARKPPTLLSLLRLFSKGRPVPTSQWELYESQCRALCEEYNLSRVAAHKVSSFSADQLLEITSRLAAVSIFTNRPTFRCDSAPDAESPSALGRSELAGGEEYVGGIPIPVGEPAIMQALETAFFIAAGRGLLRWETRNVAEFLAARYLISHQLSLQKTLSLIVHPRDSKKLVPQLHNVSAWLAERSEGVFRHIARCEADLLLSIDGAALTDGRREMIVDQLLVQAADAQLQLRWSRWRYSRLGYPGIAEKLKSILGCEGSTIEAKTVACEIGLACNTSELAKDFQRLALDTAMPRAIRVLAVLGVARFGDSGTRGSLRFLLLDPKSLESDDDDELRGAVLRAVWPAHLSFSEVLGFLTPPKRPNLAGLYSSFIRDELAQSLPDSQLLEALDWVRAHPTVSAFWSPQVECMAKLFRRGLQRISETEVRNIVGDIGYARLRAHQELVPRDNLGGGNSSILMLEENDSVRRSLVAEMLSRVEDPEHGWVFFISSHNGLLETRDFEWLLEFGQTTHVQNARTCCSFLVPRLLTFVPERIRAFYAAMKDWPALKTNAWFLLEPIELNSDLAKDLRESQHRVRKERLEREQVKGLTLALTSIDGALDKGSEATWMEVAWWLESTGAQDGSRQGLGPLSRTRGWAALGSEKRLRVLDSAKRYLLEGSARNDEWFGTRTWPFNAVAAYAALVVLLQFVPEFIDALPSDRWAEWIPVLLTFFREGTGEFADDLLKKAYRSNPDSFLRSLTARVRSEANDSLHVFVLNNLDCIWDAKISREVLDVLRGGSLPVGAFRSILGSLLQHDSVEALEYALGHLRDYRAGRNSPEFARAAAEVLIETRPRDSWQLLWEILVVDDDFATTVLEHSAYHQFMSSPLLSVLNEQELGQLFRWMLQHYPLRREEHEDTGGAVSPRFAAERLRDGLVERLASYGSYEAVQVLRTLQVEVPNFPWAIYLVRADVRARESSWAPPDPRETLEIISRPAARFVSSAEDLTEVVLEALDRIQLQLQGETPALTELWNYPPGDPRTYTPKDENDISNWLKRRLEEAIVRSGIVIGREVEIRKIPGSVGQRTDIQVVATRPRDKEKIVVVVEVKGCWNRDLTAAMQTQLVERYLKDNFYSHGIYIVGWFCCAQWAKDYRRSVVPFGSISDAQRYLSEQAAQLSKDRIHVRSFVLDASLPNEVIGARGTETKARQVEPSTEKPAASNKRRR